MPRLHGEIRDLIQAFLPDYAEARRHWPLWTYERRFLGKEEREMTWSVPDLWHDRLRWAPRVPFAAVVAELADMARRKGGRLSGFSPGSAGVTLLFAPGRVSLAFQAPRMLQAHVAAIFAVTAYPEPPASAEKITFPDRWQHEYWLDETDMTQLLGQVKHALVFARVLPSQSPEEEPPVEPPFMTRLGRMSGSEPDAESIAVAFCRKAGLLSSRRGGKKSTLPPELLTGLQSEAEELVGVIRTRQVDPNRLKLVKAVRALNVDQEAEDRLSDDDWRRWRSGEYAKLQAVLLRFPFLTPDEIHVACQEKPKQAARNLVRGRMATDVADKTYQNLLSAARRG